MLANNNAERFEVLRVEINAPQHISNEGTERMRGN